jgi:cystathionine beta-lyase family protein involved in aluminum resistance
MVHGEGRSSNRTKWSNDGLHVTSELDGKGEPEDTPGTTSVWESVANVRGELDQIDRLVAHNIKRVQNSFRSHRIGPHHFCGSTGYGHGDVGRAALDDVVASIFEAEAAACRIQFVSGTHAIAAGLFGCLRPGDELLAVAGDPYDTLEEVIGTRGQPHSGSLMDFGVSYRTMDLLDDGKVDFDNLAASIGKNTRVALVQRSCGYALRPTLTIDDIERIVLIVKSVNPEIMVLVDNCYGEFTAHCEPTAVGADLCMGSFIKNIGGTISPGAGYVVGRRNLVERAVSRMSAPGVGMDAGCVPGETLRLMFQGLYMAPATVGEALKSGRLIAEVFGSRGYKVIPEQGNTKPWSFITAIEMKSPEAMVSFCECVQRCCPVGSYVRPVPGATAGYQDEVIFADGTFIDGSTAEMSADGPIRPPYVVYCQGGFTMVQWANALEDWLRESENQ